MQVVFRFAFLEVGGKQCIRLREDRGGHRVKSTSVCTPNTSLDAHTASIEHHGFDNIKGDLRTPVWIQPSPKHKLVQEGAGSYPAFFGTASSGQDASFRARMLCVSCFLG
jgi:hypothetical protein